MVGVIQKIAMPLVFISYRRADAAETAARLRDLLAARIGEDDVFLDVAAMRLGEDFDDRLSFALARTGVMLPLIGPRWDAVDESGRRRIEASDDYVRRELEYVLGRRIATVPVLLDGARLPRSEQLPESIKALATRQGIELSAATWDIAVENLLDFVEAEYDGREFASLPAHSAYRLGLQAQAHRDYETARRLYHRVIAAAPNETADVLRSYPHVGGPDYTRKTRATLLANKAEKRLGRADLASPSGEGLGAVLGSILKPSRHTSSGPEPEWDDHDSEEIEADCEVIVAVDVAEVRRTGIVPVAVPSYIACATCDGTGVAAGRDQRWCSQCGGRQFERKRLSGLPCPGCDGSGLDAGCRCPDCDGQQATLGAFDVATECPPNAKNGTLFELSDWRLDDGHGGVGKIYVRVKTGPSADGTFEYLDVLEPPEPDPDAAVLPGLGVGGIRFGDTPGRVKERLGPGVAPDHAKTTLLEYVDAGIDVYFKDRHVDGFVVRRPWPGVTPEGIGVFATRREIEDCYGPPEEAGPYKITYLRKGLDCWFYSPLPHDPAARISTLELFGVGGRPRL